MVVTFIDAHKDRFGVEPICRVLTEHGVPIAPSTYYAARSRSPSARSVRDGQLLVEIQRARRPQDRAGPVRGTQGVA